MTEYKPLTHQERSNWALTLAYPPRDDETQLEHEMGLAILRYDDALQAKDDALAAKDAQIAALVGLVQELRDCVMDDGLPCNCGTLKDGSQYECIQCRSYTAIKEATDD